MITLFDLIQKLNDIHSLSHNLYLTRQSLELQRRQVNNSIQLTEMEMMKLDGQEEILDKLIAELKEQVRKDGK